MNTRPNTARSRAPLALALGSALLLVAACGGDDAPPQRAGSASGQPGAAADAPPAAHAAHGDAAMVAGVAFTPPERWTDLGSSGMRQAQYRLEPVDGDTEQAEVNVFYFGPESGGGTEANLRRWVGQMQLPGGGDAMEAAERSSFEVDGMPAHVVALDGTYQAGSMRPMGGGETTPMPGYRLVGVVLEGPRGSLFFKLTGPEATARAMEDELLAMVKGARKAG